MEGQFVWILMFAGAAIALMGLFLVASERELKTKRREIEELLTRLESSPENDAPAQLTGDQENAAELAQLRAMNQDLQNQIATLSSKLEASRRSIEELQTSRSEIHELENAQHNLPDLHDIESKHREERQTLETRIAGLNKEISAAREELEEMDALRRRFAESEHEQHTLRAEIRRHEEQIPKWQARIAEAEAHREQLAALQSPYSELLSKHASLADKQRELQADLAAFARLIANPAPQAVIASSSGGSSTSFGESIMSQATEQNSAPESGADDEATSEPTPNKTRGLAWFQR